MATITNPYEAFLLKLHMLYDIEKHLEEALPDMAAASSDQELSAGFKDHLEETRIQSERLEKIFELLGEEPKMRASYAIRGLIQDGQTVIDAESPDALRDAMLAGSGRAVEHYEIACYTAALDEARGLRLTDAVNLLAETLAEEAAADRTLATAMKENLEKAASESEEDAQ